MSSTKPSSNQSEQPTFKEQLDEVARESRQPANSRNNNNSSGVIEKVTEYVPVASSLLGTEKNKHEKTPPKDLSGPPYRPEHDDHIAEFVREQHRSKKPDGSLGV
ncbi:hypothetical protein F4803DRAFT_507831 [Xylaria telfairii]|nr:hypothetical protein F4803DRAFT_507831 [Xylaria telfairii]